MHIRKRSCRSSLAAAALIDAARYISAAHPTPETTYWHRHVWFSVRNNGRVKLRRLLGYLDALQAAALAASLPGHARRLSYERLSWRQLQALGEALFPMGANDERA